MNDYNKLCILLDQYDTVESVLHKKEVAFLEYARIHGIGKESKQKYGEIKEARRAAEMIFSDLQAVISMFSSKNHRSGNIILSTQRQNPRQVTGVRARLAIIND